MDSSHSRSSSTSPLQDTVPDGDYEITTNYGITYMVRICEHHVRIYKSISDTPSFSLEPCYEFQADHTYYDPGNEIAQYSTMLFRIDGPSRVIYDTYILVNIDIYSFELPVTERLIEFNSNEGCNSVCYPYALSDRYIYILIDGVEQYPRAVLYEEGVDPYVKYYDDDNETKYESVYIPIVTIDDGEHVHNLSASPSLTPPPSD